MTRAATEGEQPDRHEDTSIAERQGREEMGSLHIPPTVKGGAPAQQWRQSSLDWVTACLAVLGLIWLVAFGGQGPNRWSVAAILSFLLMSAVRWLPYRLRAGLLVVALLGASFHSAWTAGPSPGALLSGLIAIIVAGVLLDLRAALAAWLLSALGMAAAFHLLQSGIVAGPFELAYIDPRIPKVGYRFVSTYLVTSSIVAVGASALLKRLSDALERTEQALEAAHASSERAKRESDEKQTALLRLVEAQKFEVLAQLSASVAHDFNNSLQVIMANASTLHQTLLADSDEAGCAAEILDMCSQSSKVARQLLTLGQRLVLEKKVLDLGAELQSTQRALRRLIPSDIQLSVQAGLGYTAYADPVQLKQAIFNLAINASHAMPDGGTLEISLEQDAAGAGVVIVRDNGHGMDEETRRKIFEPFFSTKGAQGTGLGLATVRAIMEQHQGRVEVRSELGVGSEFRLWFPPSEDTLSDSGESLRIPVDLQSTRVLVVDDDPRVRNAIIKMLTSTGATVFGASHGEAALAELESRGAIDVLCTDAVMPKMPTRELIAKVRERSPGVAVLVCSAYVENELLRRGIEMRDVAHLPKPFSPEQLIAKIGSLLSHRQGRQRAG
jgi:signal transduction histidine kinase/CheY-like chemotaxis protein